MSEYWGLRGNQIRADGGAGPHVATYMRNREEGLLLAAAPRLRDALLALIAECDEQIEDGRSYHSHAAIEEARAAIRAAAALEKSKE